MNIKSKCHKCGEECQTEVRGAVFTAEGALLVEDERTAKALERIAAALEKIEALK